MEMNLPKLPARMMVRGLTLALCLVATAAVAQEIEQVTVYGGNLSGIWKVSRPAWLAVTLFQSPKWGPLRNAFCRIDYNQNSYTTNCYGQGPSNGGTLEVDNKRFHLAWGTMMVRMVLDGAVESATRFAGHFAVKLAGISIEDADLTEGTKIDVRTDTSDAGGKAQLVREILSGATPPHDTKLDDWFTAAHTLQLGGIEAISYLGQ